MMSSAFMQVPAYRLKLPPKRLFVHNPTPDFVEERRQQLDTYLQMLLQERQLQGLLVPKDATATATTCLAEWQTPLQTQFLLCMLILLIDRLQKDRGMDFLQDLLCESSRQQLPGACAELDPFSALCPEGCMVI